MAFHEGKGCKITINGGETADLTAHTVPSDELPFLACICNEPESDNHRLVYADYIEEQGRCAESGLIRTQIELHGAVEELPVVVCDECEVRATPEMLDISDFTNSGFQQRVAGGYRWSATATVHGTWGEPNAVMGGVVEVSIRGGDRWRPFIVVDRRIDLVSNTLMRTTFELVAPSPAFRRTTERVIPAERWAKLRDTERAHLEGLRGWPWFDEAGTAFGDRQRGMPTTIRAVRFTDVHAAILRNYPVERVTVGVTEWAIRWEMVAGERQWYCTEGAGGSSRFFASRAEAAEALIRQAEERERWTHANWTINFNPEIVDTANFENLEMDLLAVQSGMMTMRQVAERHGLIPELDE